MPAKDKTLRSSRLLTAEDRKLVRALIAEREEARRTAKELTNRAIAKKFEVSEQLIGMVAKEITG